MGAKHDKAEKNRAKGRLKGKKLQQYHCRQCKSSAISPHPQYPSKSV
jgi:hypothetical protein